MEIGQLRAFIAVAQEANFSRAADRLNLTQPSLSARIQQLERSLGGELFQRDKRPVALTRLGEIFLDYVERGLGILDAGRDAVRSAQLGLAGRVVVGCPFSLATYLMPAVLNEINQSYPQVEMHIESGSSEMIVDRLMDGLNNLAFAAAFPRIISMGQTLLRLHDEMTAAVTPTHPLAATAAATPAQLWQYRVLLIHWGPAFDAYIESLRQVAQATGPALRVPLAAALPMARQPDTITFMPRRLTAALGLVEVKVDTFHFAWDVVLMTRPGRNLAPAEQMFVDVVTAVWQRSQPA